MTTLVTTSLRQDFGATALVSTVWAKRDNDVFCDCYDVGSTSDSPLVYLYDCAGKS
jgi:hypothetical protein